MGLRQHPHLFEMPHRAIVEALEPLGPDRGQAVGRQERLQEQRTLRTCGRHQPRGPLPGGYRPGTPAGDPMPPPTEERWRPPQAPSRASPPPSPSWRRGGRPGAGFVDDDEAAAFGRYAGPGGRGRGGGRPAWPRIIALASWIILLMVLCWFYVFPWLEHVLPANF